MKKSYHSRAEPTAEASMTRVSDEASGSPWVPGFSTAAIASSPGSASRRPPVRGSTAPGERQPDRRDTRGGRLQRELAREQEVPAPAQQLQAAPLPPRPVPRHGLAGPRRGVVARHVPLGPG